MPRLKEFRLLPTRNSDGIQLRGTEVSTTIQQFRQAAKSHLALAGSTPVAGQAGQTSGSSAYLASVAIECTLKSLILKGFTVTDVDTFAQAQPRLHRALFGGKQGHALELLAASSGIRRHLGADAPTTSNPTWRRMNHGSRPYSLRYGSEAMTTSDSVSELHLAARLHSDVENLLGRRTL